MPAIKRWAKLLMVAESLISLAPGEPGHFQGYQHCVKGAGLRTHPGSWRGAIDRRSACSATTTASCSSAAAITAAAKQHEAPESPWVGDVLCVRGN